MDSSLPSRDVVLIGAGHTNAHVLRMWKMRPIPDVRLTVVSPFGVAAYSGMLPGTLAGLYEPEAMTIDLYRLAASCGARLVVAEMVGVDPLARRIELAGRPSLAYDVASIGIGSVPVGQPIWRGNPAVLSVKPMQTFLARLEEALGRAGKGETGGRGDAGTRGEKNPLRAPRSEFRAAPNPQSAIRNPQSSNQPAHTGRSPGQSEIRNPQSIVVVGAGAGGVEVAFCLDAYLQRHGHAAKLSLLDSGRSILSGYSPRAIELATREFARRNIPVALGDAAVGFADGKLQLASGKSVDADLVIWCAGAAPPQVLDKIPLPKADDGFLAARLTLQSTGDDNVFLVGDTATLVDSPVPKAGVYAVREGRVLWENIRRLLERRPLIAYRPQRGFLSMLCTGNERAIAQYKGFASHGRLAWKLKDHIDRKFMRMYQDYEPMSAKKPGFFGKAGLLKSFERPDKPTMRCRGCGGKVGANVLSAALGRLKIDNAGSAVVGLSQPDDAALLDPRVGSAEVLSVDFFQPFLDEPYLVGRVAALNALSDLWAMGARPIGAMAIVTVPEGPPKQQTEFLYQLLAGGVREFAQSGVSLLGGHTTESDEPTIGYSVVGTMDGRAPFTKGNLEPSDRLILTKPLGTGTLLAAHMQAACRAPWMESMLASMLRSNAAAAGVARDHNVKAVTDITGFGLAGHLLEMLDASGAAATVSLDALPLLDGFAELSRQGIRSSLDAANRETEDHISTIGSADHGRPAYHALFDPQTSGGLLIAAKAKQANAIVEALRAAGYGSAAIVGVVEEKTARPMLKVVIDRPTESG